MYRRIEDEIISDKIRLSFHFCLDNYGYNVSLGIGDGY